MSRTMRIKKERKEGVEIPTTRSVFVKEVMRT
jgi:hypothetical protein